MLCRSDIIDPPFLIQSVVLLPGENVGSVRIFASCNVKHKGSFVDYVFTLELEVLLPDVSVFVPLGESSPTGMSNVQCETVICLWLDACGLGIVHEQLVITVLVEVADNNL